MTESSLFLQTMCVFLGHFLCDLPHYAVTSFCSLISRFRASGPNPDLVSPWNPSCQDMNNQNKDSHLHFFLTLVYDLSCRIIILSFSQIRVPFWLVQRSFDKIWKYFWLLEKFLMNWKEREKTFILWIWSFYSIIQFFLMNPYNMIMT